MPFDYGDRETPRIERLRFRGNGQIRENAAGAMGIIKNTGLQEEKKMAFFAAKTTLFSVKTNVSQT